MRTLRTIVAWFMLAAFLLFVYDAGKSWFVDKDFKIRDIDEILKALAPTDSVSIKSFMTTYIPSEYWDLFVHLPGPLFLLAIAGILYLIFRLWCLLAGTSPAELFKKRRRQD